MDFLIAVLKGIVEGLTEFIPVSSTGHVILMDAFIKFQHLGSGERLEKFLKLFAVVLNSGAILAVILFFKDKINPFSSQKTSEERTQTWSIWFKVFVAFIPAAVVGLIFKKNIMEYLYNPLTVSIALLVGGIALVFIEWMKNKKHDISTIGQITYQTALFIGLFQCIALIPGVSRSAATIIGAMLLGLTRQNAAEFSFFLAIPTIVLSSAFVLLRPDFTISRDQWFILATGFVVSFAVAWPVISVFMNFIRKHDFKPFGYYRIALGAVIIALFIFGIMK